MQHFYDGQIRRYLTQTIRVFSNFVVKYGDGTLHRIPVMYGDADRQVASILRGNSENKLNSVPRIAVYVNALEMDRERLSDSSYVGKIHIRERDVINGNYTQSQGRNYTVERLMPTPYKLTMKVDIWSANTDQKLQILEQILVLFNPSLELQTSDNFVDWTALTVLNMSNVNWSSRTVPVGNDSPIDIATLTVDTPIWISPPAKVKHLGVITKIITSLWGAASTSQTGYIDGLGTDLAEPGTTTVSNLISSDAVSISDYNIRVFQISNESAKVVLLSGVGVAASATDWQQLFDQYPGQFFGGSSQIFITQADGNVISGTVAVDPLDPTVLDVSIDPYTIPSESELTANWDNSYTSVRSSNGTFDAIIDPTTIYPGHGMVNPVAGDRFLIVEDTVPNTAAWGNFAAHANDIIEYDGSAWHVLFDSVQDLQPLLQANIYNNVRVQYAWDGVSWVKSFEGDYKVGQWRIVL